MHEFNFLYVQLLICNIQYTINPYSVILTKAVAVMVDQTNNEQL